MDRKQFTFYHSFYDAVVQMDNDKDKLDLLMAIIEYALLEKEPDLSGLLQVAFTLVKPTLDTARRKAENGSKGGKANSKLWESPSSSLQTNSKLWESPSSSLQTNSKLGESSSSSLNTCESKGEREEEEEKEKEKERKKEKEKEIEKEKYSSSLGIPTEEETEEFFKKMKLPGDPHQFFAYNTANGWKVKNWQLAAVAWKPAQTDEQYDPEDDLIKKGLRKLNEQ